MKDQIASRLAFMELEEAQRSALRGTQGVVRDAIGKALDRFYARAGATPETARFFRDQAHMGQAKAAQERHWTRIAAGSFDGDYHASARRIGATHARIGLEPRWYVGSYALVLEELVRHIQRRQPWHRRLLAVFRPASGVESSIAVMKAALLDMEVSLSIYFEEAQAATSQAVTGTSAALAKLAAGDLTTELHGLPAAFSDMERSYNDAVDKLRDMIGAVGEGAMRIDAGVREIAQASDDLARRTQGNAASLEETTAAVSQIDARIKATAVAAESTVARADQASATVGDGRSVAEQAVVAMGRVSESAKGIDDVIEGLDKIAFQTRVLAMNAAVEAGRAGEAGRGFAVVADLVSALAMRAEEEAKRAREQLSTTQSEITAAVEAVQKVDGALLGISGDVGEVHALLSSMARDNAAQATAVSEVNGAIGAMDRSTQQNAAMVEQTSAAARTLAGEVHALAERTAAFQVDRGSAAARRSASTTIAALPPASFAGVKQLPPAAVDALRHPAV